MEATVRLIRGAFSDGGSKPERAHPQTMFRRIIAGLQPRAKISVIVPIYDKAAHLRECLESISNQSCADIEVICVDDCSTDGSLDIAADHAARDRRFTVLLQDANRGAGPARNHGIELASAPLIQFTDADDLLPQSALHLLEELIAADDVAVVRGTLGHFADSAGQVSFDPAQVMPDRHRFRLTDERKLWIPYFHVCYLFRTAFLRLNRLAYPPLRCGEDPVFLASCLVHAPAISTTSATSYLYRRNVPVQRHTIASALDFIRHIGMVRDLYLASGHDRIWQTVCDDFYRDDTKAFLTALPQADADSATVRAALENLWTDAVTPPASDGV